VRPGKAEGFPAQVQGQLVEAERRPCFTSNGVRTDFSRTRASAQANCALRILR
jgi:hypothetical protein